MLEIGEIVIVSIIIPVYKVEDYLDECVNSVVKQSYRDLEIILVDDGSPDYCPKICDQWAEKDARIKVLHKQNGGLSDARNVGLEAATGDYVFFLDSDDWILPNCIELLVEKLKQYPESDLVQGGTIVTDGSIPWFNLENSSLPEYSEDRFAIKTQLLGREQLPVTSWNKLVRLSLIKDHRLFFVKGLIHEDIVWNNLLAKHVTALSVLHKNTYVYRIRENSIKTSGLNLESQRLLKVYSLLIDAIDPLYIKEQIDWLIFLLDKLYFENNASEIRKEVGRLNKKLSSQCLYPLSIRLKVKSWLALHCERRYSDLFYFFYYQLSCDKSILDICFTCVKKVIHF